MSGPGASADSEPRRSVALNYALVVTATFLLLVFLQVATGALQLDRMRVGGIDPVDLFAYLPSLFFDGDVSFENEYRHLSPGFLKAGNWPRTVTDHVGNCHNIGMAIAQSPFYAATYLAVAIRKRSFPVPQQFKYMPAFEYSWYIGNIFWSAVAAFLLAWWLRKDCGVQRPIHVAVFFVLATPLLYYAFPLSPMSHPVSLAAVLLMLLSLGKGKRTGKARWLLAAGLALGFAVSVHILNAVYIVFIGAYCLIEHIQRRKKDSLSCPKPTTAVVWRNLSLVSMGALVGYLPQMIVNSVIYGTCILNPYDPGNLTGHFRIGFSRLLTLLEVAFSMKHGFISWHPILGLGLAGLIFSAIVKREHFMLALSGLVPVCATWAIVSCSVNWWVGWSFGHRVFISVYPFLALGIAVLVDSLLERRRRWKTAVVWSLACLFTLWNVLFAVQYKLGMIPRGEAITFREYFWQKLLLIGSLVSGGNGLRF